MAVDRYPGGIAMIINFPPTCRRILDSCNAVPIERLFQIDPRQVAAEGFDIFLGGAGVEDDDAFMRFDPTAFRQSLQGSDAGGRFGANGNAFERRCEMQPFVQAVLIDGDGGAPTFANGVENHEIADGNGNAEAAGE